eukprot:TRINITY_DN7073_c0_g1_i3.p1 TRINITY_DN7073_c0_g1~~TRINITY_DN7073_c0_g1_i3.p1  ORF type:complete len:113 (+),score=14.46 TRINITY_DN7073_c0_g1_i3:151-489(+)
MDRSQVDQRSINMMKQAGIFLSNGQILRPNFDQWYKFTVLHAKDAPLTTSIYGSIPSMGGSMAASQSFTFGRPTPSASMQSFIGQMASSRLLTQSIYPSNLPAASIPGKRQY